MTLDGKNTGEDMIGTSGKLNMLYYSIGSTY